MSKAQDDASHKAYVVGRNAYLHDPQHGRDANPYPIQSPYHEAFEQGFGDERDKDLK